MNCQAILGSGIKKGTICGAKTAKKYKEGHTVHYLCGRHNKMFRELAKPGHAMPNVRLVENSNGMIDHIIGSVYPNQDIASREIMEHFQHNVRAVTLAAQMMSGKTGTMKNTVVRFSEYFDYNVVVCVVLTINDNELLGQTRREFGAYVPHNQIHSAIDIQCSQYLKQLRSGNPGKKLLVVVDESHYGCEKGKVLDTYFSNADIGIDGCALPEDVYLLTVSATCNAELAMTIHAGVRAHKGHVVLKPGAGYYGIEDMIKARKLHEGWSLKTVEDMDRLEMLCLKYSAHTTKYVIVRCMDDKRIAPFRERMIKHRDLKFITYVAGSDITDINSVIHVPSQQFTVIAIARKLSAGKQLLTSNIAMVFDYSDGEISTSVQGLTGRCCGYGKAAHGVDLYVNVKHASTYATWANEGFLPEATPNDKYVTGGVSGAPSDEWEKNVPLPLDISDIDNVLLKAAATSNRYAEITDQISDLIYQQYPEIFQAYGQPLNGEGIMVLSQKTAKSTWDLWWHNLVKMVHKESSCVGYPRSLASVAKENGYFVFINADTKEALMTHTKKSPPRGKPVVSATCAYRPTVLPQH